MRLGLDGRARRLLRRFSRGTVYSLLELILLALLAMQVARLFWTLVTPVDPLGAWRPASVGVPGTPAAILRGFDPFFRGAGGTGGPRTAVVTSLQLTLFGTRLDESGSTSSAIIKVADGDQQSFVIGDEIQPGVVLKSVAFDHVTIDRGGQGEDLYLDQSKAPGADPAAPDAGPSAVGVAPVIGETPGGPGAAPPGGGKSIAVGRLSSEIGFTPRVRNGKLTGLALQPQGSGELMRSMGLRPGDVVTAAGGKPVASAADLQRAAAAAIAGGGTLSLTIERGSQILPITVPLKAQ